MDSYQNYLNHFKKYSPQANGTNNNFKALSEYSTYINNKANEIVSNAASDQTIDTAELQKEIFQLGVDYVKLFATMNKAEKSDPY